DYRVRGLDKNLSYEVLKVNIFVAACAAPGSGSGAGFHVDTLDLYSAKHRVAYVRAAAVELGVKDAVIKHDLGQVLRKLEVLQEALIQQAQAPEKEAAALSPDEEQDALDLLRDPNLIERLIDDFARCGIVGETTNLLVGYLACVSRQLEKPLAVLIQSTSAAGKSALMEAVLQMMPEETRVAYSAMTGQSLFYLGESDLKHKILAIAEEEGASRAAYALKLLQSEGVLTIASTGKDPQSGQLVTQAYRVEGPVMLFLTTTAIEIDEELLNRCLVLSVNESREQTRAIQVVQRQRQTLEGLLADADKSAVLNTHRNAQRLLKPYLVANPYAEQLTFLDAKTRTRRDHVKYLTLIRAIALLHQHQREVKHIEHGGEVLDYIEVTPTDIALANRLANEVLGRTLDELPAQTRRLLTWLDGYVSERTAALAMDRSDVRFTRRDIREAIGWSDTQLRVHLARLVALEYLIVHHGARGQRFVYELIYEGEGDDGQTFLPGLIEVERLESPTTTATSRGETGEFAGPTRPQRGGFAARSRVGENGANPSPARASEDRPANPSETASKGEKISTPSYRDRRTDRNSLTSLAALGKA
ncbi:MAG: DNA primase, partial [Steroidobacteraceae bacterium]